MSVSGVTKTLILFYATFIFLLFMEQVNTCNYYDLIA